MSIKRGGKKHVHKYHKVFINGSMTWACGMPDCSHYLPKNMENTIMGKYSVCWSCGKDPFILDENALKMDKPECFDCRHPELKNVDDDVFSKFLSK